MITCNGVSTAVWTLAMGATFEHFAHCTKKQRPERTKADNQYVFDWRSRAIASDPGENPGLRVHCALHLMLDSSGRACHTSALASNSAGAKMPVADRLLLSLP